MTFIFYKNDKRRIKCKLDQTFNSKPEYGIMNNFSRKICEIKNYDTIKLYIIH